MEDEAVSAEEVSSEKPEVRKVATYRVRNYIDADTLKKDLSYSLVDLSTAMMEQASYFIHYGALAAKASRQVDDLKLLLENTEARVYRIMRDSIAAEGVKITEAMLEKKVAVHHQVVAFKKALNEAKQIEAIAKTAVEAFRHRRDMLVQQGLISREEMKGEVSIRAKREAEASIEDLKERALRRLAANPEN